jgi:hypothetical protein
MEPGVVAVCTSGEVHGVLDDVPVTWWVLLSCLPAETQDAERGTALYPQVPLGLSLSIRDLPEIGVRWRIWSLEMLGRAKVRPQLLGLWPCPDFEDVLDIRGGLCQSSKGLRVTPVTTSWAFSTLSAF